MRRENKTYKLVFSLIILLSFTTLIHGQKSSIPLNHNRLPVISTLSVYKRIIKDDPSKRMVALKNYIIPLFVDFKYSTTENFTTKILYLKPAAYLRLEAATALRNVQEELKKKGLTLIIFDAYRPYSVTEKMWEVMPDDRYAANPANGSGHNRGAAIDVTLAELATGKQLEMPTAYDDFSEKAHHDYLNLEKDILANRQLLRTLMEKHGFAALETEWWHYSLPNASKKFELMDLTFREMKSISKSTFD